MHFDLSLFALLIGIALPFSSGQIQQINVGAFFYETESHYETYFKSVIQRINSEGNNFILYPLIRRLSATDASVVLQREACDLIDNGVVAIFGPSSKAENDVVELICNSTGVPHIKFDVANEEATAEELNHQMTVNVYPSQLILSKAYADITQSFGWKKFTIVYDADDDKAPSRLQDLLQLRDVHKEVVRVRKFRKDEDYRIMWKSIKGERRIILDCEPELLVDLLNASIPFDLTGQFNHLFLTNLETHSSDIDVLKDNITFAVNVTAARLKLNGNFYNANNWQRASLYNFDPNSMIKPRTLLFDLIYDALKLFTHVVQNVTNSYPVNPPRVKCDFDEYGKGQTWPMGRYLAHLMKSTSGVNNTMLRSSNLQFDEEGQRINFMIEVYEPLDNYGIATWDTKGQITPLHVEANVAKKIVYRVATRIGQPYFMENLEAVRNNITGNARYEGYAVDLIEALSKEVGFEYLFVPVKDNAYGKYNKETKQWNGIVGELINNDAHMGICDLTITQARRTVVDFTVPFMQLGISILAYKKPYEPKHILAFLDPFGVEVWVYVMIAIFLMSVLFVFVARISKDEWENPHPCNPDPDRLENKWHLSNTFWLTMGSIMTQGSDILPRSAPMRTFNAMWFIFAIIIANSYTANLAAFLTNKQMEGTIAGIKDLAEQTKVKFGTMEGGSTYTFFSESNETTYRLAFNIMNNDDPSAYTKDNTEGVERVLKNRGGYMFLMETTSLEYNTERDCELRMVGEKFGEKHYAIAVPFGAEYRSNLSVAILKLSERGELFQLKNKWWKYVNRTCYVAADPDATPDMTFEEVRGIFYTLCGGIFLAFILGIGEFLAYCHSVAVEEKLTFKQALKKELAFVFRIWNNKKPISCTPTASIKSSRRSSERTPKSSRHLMIANSSEEMKESALSIKSGISNGTKIVHQDENF